MKRKILITTAAVVLVAVGVVLGLTLTGGSTPPITAHGTEETTTQILDGQTPPDAFPDISQGSQVVVINSAGTVIATGTLGPAKIITPYDLTYPFTVQVPGGLPRYGIEIGHNRSTVWFTAAQMQGPALCLGDGC